MQTRAARRLLAVVAHPDDETFGCGGVLAKYAAEGAQVFLLCATRGEVGEISDPALATRDNLGQVREQELRSACDALGIEQPLFLGYRNSGMDGAPENEHPEAFCRASKFEVTGKIVEVVRKLRPQVLMTFDGTGGYGHPDHITAHKATGEAFYLSGQVGSYPEQLANGVEPYGPQKLYYFSFPRSLVWEFQEAVRAAGGDTDFTELDPESLGIPDEEITSVVDMAAYVDHKENAARCHRTQVQGNPFDWVPESLKVRVLSAEYLIRVEPRHSAHDRPGEDGLFSGIKADIEE